MIRQRKPISRNIRPKAKRAGKRRVSVTRCPKYLAWLKGCRCMACYQEVRGKAPITVASWIIDPAHGPVNGRGSKGPDNEAIPLCRHHHDEQHRIGWPAFCVKYGFDRAREAAAHYVSYLIVSGKLPEGSAA